MTAISASVGTVQDVMTADPVVVGVDCPLTEAAELLNSYSISGAPVVDWSGFLVGVVSQTDLVRAQASEELSARWHRLCVRDVMTRPALTVHRSASLAEVADLMTTRQVHRLVVTDGEDDPVGIISSSDLVRTLAEGCGDEAQRSALELAVELS